METTAQALRRISLFNGLSDSALARVADAAIRRTYTPGEIIIIEGDPCQAAYFVAEGQVRVYRLSPGGREQVLVQLRPGQAFNTAPPFQPRGINHLLLKQFFVFELVLVISGMSTLTWGLLNKSHNIILF